MSGYKWIVAASGSVALFCMATVLYAAIGGKSHLGGIDCGTCHRSGQEVNPEQASKLVAPQDALCGGCHANAVRVSHPIGFMPKAELPAAYPPDWKGDLTCSTCHRVHGSERGLLRGAKRGKEMCLACHDAVFFNSMKDGGGSIEQSGHSNAVVAPATAELDPYSMQCLGCHDSKASADGAGAGRNVILCRGSGAPNHPIGRPYRRAFQSGGYRPENGLSKKILLPDGKVSCVSCHEGYKKDHGKLVMSNRGSALCFECHDA